MAITKEQMQDVMANTSIQAAAAAIRGALVLKTPVALSGTAQLVLAANLSRISGSLYNAGPNAAYLGPSNAVTSTNYTHVLQPGDYLLDTDTYSAWYANTAAGQTATIYPGEVSGGVIQQGVTVQTGAVVSLADGGDATEGTMADAVVAAGAAGTVSAKLRRLTTDLAALLAQIPATLGQKAKAASLSVTLASDQDAIGLAAGTNKVGGVTIADGDNATQGAIADAVVAAGAAGSLSAKLRRLTTDLAAHLANFVTATAMGDTDSLTTTTTRVGAYLMGSNGVNFIRARLGIYGNLTNNNSAQHNALLVAAQGLLFEGTNQSTTRGAAIFKTFTISASAAETTIWTPAAGKKFRLMGFALFSDTATVLTFRDNTGGTIIWKDGVAANSRANCPAIQNGILSAAANNVLSLQCGTAATVNGVVYGTEE